MAAGLEKAGYDDYWACSSIYEVDNIMRQSEELSPRGLFESIADQLVDSTHPKLRMRANMDVDLTRELADKLALQRDDKNDLVGGERALKVAQKIYSAMKLEANRLLGSDIAASVNKKG